MSASSFQPLLPEDRAQAPLLAQAAALIAEGHRLESAAGQLGATLRPLLRSMNSYYTNKIEGQHTRPADIERALHQQFDADKKQARRQRLALAHIQAEEELEGSLPSTRTALYAPEFVQRIHANLYRLLPSTEQVSDDGEKVVPGGFRTSGRVTTGQHLAPDAGEIPELIQVWQKRYSALPGHEQAVVGAVCSHHRLLWIHPFPDGNGRAARLHTHLVLTARPDPRPVVSTPRHGAPARGILRAAQQCRSAEAQRSRRPRPAIAGRARRIRQLVARGVPGSGPFHA